MPSASRLEQGDIPLSYSDEPQWPTQGLGITGTTANRPISIARKPVGATSPPQVHSDASSFQSTTGASAIPRSSPNTPEAATPGSAKPFLSPPWHRESSNDYTYGDGVEGDLSAGRPGQVGETLFLDESLEPYTLQDDTVQLKHGSSSSVYKVPLAAGCPTKRDIHSGRGSWLSITLLLLSFYSMVMSIVWLITASARPRWGRSIYTSGPLTPSTASLLSALFAKTIELSFVTVFVGFLGQVLTRRSIDKYSKGITIAEMSMRTWVIQSGFMITHWQSLRYVGWTFLGVLSFIAALCAMLYTTASDALVSPKIQFGAWKDINMQGLVQTSYANPQFIEQNCQTPITPQDDGQAALTCVAVKHAGQSMYIPFSSYSSLEPDTLELSDKYP
jgi:hypothetical protein